MGFRTRNSAGSAEDCSGYETDDCAERAEKEYRRHRSLNTAVMLIVRKQADSEIADDRASRVADNQAKQSCEKSAHAFPLPSRRPNVRCYVGEVELRGGCRDQRPAKRTGTNGKRSVTAGNRCRYVWSPLRYSCLSAGFTGGPTLGILLKLSPWYIKEIRAAQDLLAEIPTVSRERAQCAQHRCWL